MIQTAEGALNETHSILQRMRELSIQASNDTNTLEDRQSIGDEIFELKKEIDRISETTKFNGKGLLNGDTSTAQAASSTAKLGEAVGSTVISKVDVSGAVAGTTYTIKDGDAADGKITMSATVNGKTISEEITVGANSQTLNFASLGITIELAGTDTSDNITAALDNLTVVTEAGNGNATFLVGSNGEAAEKITVDFKKMDTTTLGSGLNSNISDKVTDNSAVDSVAKADALTAVIDDAIKQVSQQRSNLGANQNRLEHTINNLNTSSENLTAAESRIRDVDYTEAA